jgi:hypothetical protein
LDYPLKEYGHFVQEVALDFYNTKTVDALERQFVAHGPDGLMSLQAELVEVIRKALKRSEVYNNFDSYWESGNTSRKRGHKQLQERLGSES